ncbi:hypothetical protein B296_00017962 [Ensete ventricosum]|uniref:Uncharacterized protein n=1 Tax=Ensete ventricosum TaxID=4639 RepID=A0A426ZVF7_ENSVE|nr:hypothetical protein B296_00017962 [Ensete ventricosum]
MTVKYYQKQGCCTARNSVELSLPLRCCSGTASSLLHHCSDAASLVIHHHDAAAPLPPCRFAAAMLQQHRLCATVMLLFPFDAAAASHVSLHFSISFFHFFLSPSSSVPPPDLPLQPLSSSSKHRYTPMYHMSVHRYRAAHVMLSAGRHTSLDQ